MHGLLHARIILSQGVFREAWPRRARVKLAPGAQNAAKLFLSPSSSIVGASLANVIAYLRVSTDEQRRFGLGIEVQRALVERFCASRSWPIIREYVEAETGRRDHLRNRPEFRSALAHAKRLGATLVVARLDRLSRSVLVTAQFLASRVAFVAVDAPDASRLTVQLSALMAEYESRLISERTKEGMRAARARGVSFARNHWSFTPEIRLKAAENAARAHTEAACEAYADIAPDALALRDAGERWVDIARFLNAAGHTTRRAGPWTIHSVKRLVIRESNRGREHRKFVLSSFQAVFVGARAAPRLATPPRELLPQKESIGFELRQQAVAPGRAVVYCRVSTKKQAAIGHSLQAQLQIVNRFCGENNLHIIGTYTEIERAWRTKLDQRPQLIEALAHAKAAGAKLVISRLDRLSRNASVVTGLLESRASFVVADAPWASEFTLLLLSAIAHEESRLISARMIEVRAEAKVAGRIWKHVCNLRPEDRMKALQLANEARRHRTFEHDTYVGPIAREMRASATSLARIALQLNERGLHTQRGTEWTDNSVLHLLRRIGVAPGHRARALKQG